MTELTHERVSELLGPYSSGELEESMRARVDSHLAACDGCARELAGITALHAGDFEPMTGPERDRITTAVRAAVVPVAGPRWSERFGRRLAPALGAAALIAVAIVGYVSFQDDGSSPAEVGTATQEGDSDGAAADSTLDDDSGAGSAAADRKAEKDTSAAASAETLEVETGTLQGTDATNVAPPITVAVGSRFAGATFTPDLFAPRDARNRSFAVATEAGGAFAADDPTVAAMAEECARIVIDTSPHPSLTPTYAAHFPADDIIVIGFVWRDERSDGLNFELRGWRGDSCNRVSPIYRSGPV